MLTYLNQHRAVMAEWTKDILRSSIAMTWWWCYPIPTGKWGREETPRDPTVGPRSKVWTRG